MNEQMLKNHVIAMQHCFKQGVHKQILVNTHMMPELQILRFLKILFGS